MPRFCCATGARRVKARVAMILEAARDMVVSLVVESGYGCCCVLCCGLLATHRMRMGGILCIGCSY
jgi:hypothetical protein